MTHTPGPWTSENGAIKAANHYHVAEISAPYHLQNEITEANAHLIAAAPDLLALLKEGVRLYLKAGFAETGQWVTEANAAIAKAEGKS